MSAGLAGRVAVVTGAARGIGRVYAEALARSGASVLVADLDAAGAQAAARELCSQGLTADSFGVDITSPQQAAAMAACAEERWGGIDILVNNAAFMKPVMQPLLEYPLEAWQQTLDVNLTGSLLCIRACVPSMRRRGGGRIVNQSSGGAFQGGHAYGISKLAVQGLTVWMAQELGPSRITVNCIAPGMIDTPAGGAARPPGMLEALAPSIPLKALGSPEDLVGPLLFLVSDAASWVTGQIVCVDGGWVKRVA